MTINSVNGNASSAETLVEQDRDWSAIADRYSRVGRVQVLDFLQKDSAGQLLCLAKSPLPWVLHYRADGNSLALAESDLAASGTPERKTFDSRLVETAKDDFQFSYFGCSLAPRDLNRFPSAHAIHTLSRRIMSREFVSILSACTGDRSIKGLTASLTRYDPGQFLLPHDDTDTKDDRRAAFVLNLSEDWWPDWGGLLQFIDEERNVTETFSPHYGSLALFKVPQMHAVSLIAPHALRLRFAITGWLVA